MGRVLISFASLFLALFLLIAGFFSVYADRSPRSIYNSRMSELGSGGQAEIARIYSYLGHRGDNLDFLTRDESSHMRDVRSLLDVTKTIFVLAIIVLVFVGQSFARRYRKGTAKEKPRVIDDLRRVFLFGGIIALALTILLALAVSVDFLGFWFEFHGVLFPQGNWQFPAGSVLITLFPQEFFESFVLQSGLAAASFAAIAVLTSILQRIKRPS